MPGQVVLLKFRVSFRRYLKLCLENFAYDLAVLSIDVLCSQRGGARTIIVSLTSAASRTAREEGKGFLCSRNILCGLCSTKNFDRVSKASQLSFEVWRAHNVQP